MLLLSRDGFPCDVIMNSWIAEFPDEHISTEWGAATNVICVEKVCAQLPPKHPLTHHCALVKHGVIFNIARNGGIFPCRTNAIPHFEAKMPP